MELAWIAEATPPSGTNSIFEVLILKNMLEYNLNLRICRALRKLNIKM